MARPSTERIGTAIDQVMAGADMSQTELARRLRDRGWSVDQSRISKWKRGVEVPHELMLYAAIEEECAAPRGTLFRRAGFVDDGTDVRSAIAADPALSDEARALLLDVYESALRRSTAAAMPANPAASAAVASRR